MWILILGAKNLVEASITNNVKNLLQFQLIKLLIQLIFMVLANLLQIKIFLSSNNLSASKTKFSVTRYGNVIGSKGSIIEYTKTW